MVTEVSLGEYRELMGLVQQWTFLNHAATSPITRAAREVIATHVEDICCNAAVNRHTWLEQTRDARQLAAELLHCAAAEIAFVKNTSEGVSMVANGLALGKGDAVVTTDIEYPANIYPWMALSEKGVSVELVPNKNGRIPAEDILATVDERTRVIALSSVEFSTGFRHDLRRIGEFCCKRGIFFFVDGIQSVGALEVDVKHCHISALSAGAQKWLLGPVGAGILFVDKEWLPRVAATEIGWLTVENAEEYLDYRLVPRKDARKFECGSLNLVGIIGMAASVKVLLKVGIPSIENRIMGLTDHLCEGLEKKGYEVYSSRKDGEKSGIVLFSSDTYPAEELWRRLMDENIITSVRYGRVRVSPHFYNSEEEIDKVIRTVP